ncbi:MAG TPA: HEAT repeat domain-containing protein, partial [Gemmatimonadales bacterium]
PPAPAPPAAPPPSVPRAAAAGSLPLPAGASDVVAQLTRDPTGPAVGDLLAALVHHVELALKQRRPDQLLGVISAIVRVEENVPEASGVRRQYAIALRRVYTKSALDALARLVSEPKYRADAVVALRRGGAGAVEVLMDHLVAAPTMDERRSAFDALRHMTEGTDQLVHALEHEAWFVVRNVAELIGELGMEGAVPALARRLEHEDERVRKAVAMALAKIGTRAAVEPLRRALHDPSPEVRMQVALGIGGQKSAALAMPLVVAMDEEKDEDVLRELILALGRIGSSDAVQALIKCSQPAGRIFGRKSAALRLAAVEGLRLAGTPAARGTLDGLADDGDKQVRTAARAAVSELGRKPRR